MYLGFLLLAALLPAQSVERNRVSVSAGWGEQISFYPYERQSAPVLGLSYAFRPLRWFELETGLFAGLQPGLNQCSAHGCFDPNDRYFWVPFGVRFVAPIAWHRVELSGGGGGLYENYSVSNANFNVYSRSGWGGYFAGGAAVAIDRRHHFWLGATPRFFLANPKYARDRWFVITGDVSFRF